MKISTRWRFLLLAGLAVLGGIFSLSPRRTAPAARANEGAPDPLHTQEAQSGGQKVSHTVSRAVLGREAPSARVSIAAGGLASNVHRADVFLQFDPPLDGNTEVDLSLTGGGTGYGPASWWWSSISPGKIPAKLQRGYQTFTYGQTTSPLAFTPSGSTLGGTLTSSNMVETTTVLVCLPSKGITLTCPVDFVAGDCVVDLGAGAPLQNTWTNFTVKRRLGTHGIDGHTVTVVVSQVVLNDGSVLSASAGSDAGSSTDLSEYVELDGPLLTYSYESVTTDANGGATGQYEVIHSGVKTFTLTALDMNVATDDSQ